MNNQEIRNCIYGGSFNALLAQLDKREDWRKLNRMTNEDSNYRFVKQELILRFFAFLDVQEKYKGQVAKFLNDYMHANRHAKDDFLTNKKDIFNRVMSLLVGKVFPEGPPVRIPTSVMEAALVGMARNIDHLEQLSPEQVVQRYHTLRGRPEFNEDAVAEGLSKIDKVKARFTAADAVFSS